MTSSAHSYINIKHKGEIFEAGVTYVVHNYTLPDGMNTPATCTEVVSVDCERHFSDSVVKRALRSHLKKQNHVTRD